MSLFFSIIVLPKRQADSTKIGDEGPVKLLEESIDKRALR